MKAWATTTGLAIAAVVFCARCAAPEPPAPVWRGMPYPDPLPLAQDFTLTDQHGKPFRLDEHRGRLVLLFFGYVHCPDVCPVTLSTWARVATALEDARDGVEFVFVTVDPGRDTPERLARHLEVFGGGFHGLSGSEQELAAVYEDYGIFEEKIPVSSAGGYVVDHSTRMLLIDASGRLRLRYAFDVDPDDIVHDMRLLLAEPVTAADRTLEVRGAWARPTIAAGSVASAPPETPTAVYFTVTNPGAAADRLLGAESEVARTVELHETRIEGDRMRMVPLALGAEVPARGELALRPGGMHLMLIDLERHLAPGETFPIVLRFRTAAAATVEVEVREP